MQTNTFLSGFVFLNFQIYAVRLSPPGDPRCPALVLSERFNKLQSGWTFSTIYHLQLSLNTKISFVENLPPQGQTSHRRVGEILFYYSGFFCVFVAGGNTNSGEILKL